MFWILIEWCYCTLDTSDPAEKLEWLYQLKKHLNEHLMSSIEISMDLPVGTDSLEERLDYVKRHLQTVARFGTSFSPVIVWVASHKI